MILNRVGETNPPNDMDRNVCRFVPIVVKEFERSVINPYLLT